MPSIFSRAPSAQIRATAVFSEQALTVLGPNVCKALAEKQVETKRKGAKEIEELIRFYQEKELGIAREQTTSMLNILLTEFLDNHNRDIAIGGLIGVLGAARGLQENLKYYLGQIMVPVLKKFSSTSETTLRYYAAECIYNLCILAPAGVVCLLDELTELAFALWKDSDTRLARPAGMTDSLLKGLTVKYATSAQLSSLFEFVLSEISSRPTLAPVYVISWLELLINRSEELEFDFSIADAIAAIIQLGAYNLSEDHMDTLESLIDKLTSSLKSTSRGKASESLNLVEAKTQQFISDRQASQSRSLWTSLVSSICGLNPSRRRVEVKQAMEMTEENKEFLANVSAAVLSLIMSLFLHSGSDIEYLRFLSIRIQNAVSGSPTRNFLLSDISKVLSTALISGKKANNHLLMEAALQWLIFLIKTASGRTIDLPPECFQIVIELVSSSRTSIRQLAISCIVELVQDGSSLQSILDGAVTSLGDVDSVEQAVASMNMIRELLLKGDVNLINVSLKGMKLTSNEEIFRYILAAFLSAFLVFDSDLYLWLTDIAGWNRVPSTELMINMLMTGGCSLTLDFYVPGSFLMSQVEATVLLLELPNCLRGRLTSSLFYAGAARLLPCSSSGALIAQKRGTDSEIAGIPVGENNGTWRSTCQLDVRNMGQWEEIYVGRLRSILYPLVEQSLSRWGILKTSVAPAAHSVWEVEAAEDVVICQDTPTRQQEDNTSNNRKDFAFRKEDSPMNEKDGTAELTDDDQHDMEAQVQRETSNNKTHSDLGVSSRANQVDQPVNDTPNQSGLMSDISTEPNSPSEHPQVPVSTLSRMVWSS